MGKRPRLCGSGATASANMSFKSGAVTKRTRADLLLLALASLLVRGGERVGFTGMEGAPASSRPGP